jgi:DnaJ-class molecular chaperone
VPYADKEAAQLDKRELSINYNSKVIQPGEIMKIKSEGMTILNNSNVKGDLYIHFSVNLPKVLDNSRKEILQKVLGHKKSLSEKIETQKPNVTVCTLEEIKNYNRLLLILHMKTKINLNINPNLII